VFRTRLTLGYNVDQGGAKIRLQTNDSIADPKIGVEFAYGWANFLGKKITVSAGKIDGHEWGLGKLHTNAFDPGFDALTGVRAAFAVVDNVSFGFALPFDQVTYYQDTSEKKDGWVESLPGSGTFIWTQGGITTSKTTAVAANRTLGAIFGGVVVGGRYTSDFINAVVGLKLNPAINGQDYGAAKVQKDHDGDPATDPKKGYYETPSWVEVIAGVSVKPIGDPLAVALHTKIDTRKFDDDAFAYWKDDKEKVGYARIGLKGEYTGVPALTASLKFDLYLRNDKAEKGKNDNLSQYYSYDENNLSDPTKTKSIKKEDYVDYKPVETLGDPSLGFELGAEYKVAETITAYLKLGSDNLLWFAGDVDLKLTSGSVNIKDSAYAPGAGLWVKPGVKIALGAASIEIFDKIDKIGAADLQYLGETSDTNSATKVYSFSPITNQFQIDFNWAF
jgi:hypothetical protein